MNAGPAGSAVSRSRARLGLGSAAAEREVYKAAPGNGAASRRGRPGPSRRPAGARHCLAAGAREGAAGSGAWRGSARGGPDRCPGRPASPAISTDAGDTGPPPSRPSGTRRSAAAARPLLEDAVASPRARPLAPGPDSWEAERANPSVHDPSPRSGPLAPALNSLEAVFCPVHAPPSQVLPTPLGPRLLGSIALHPVHAHLLDACCPHPSPPPCARPAHRTCLRHSPRFSQKVAGVGVLPHCVSVGESLRLSELPPWSLLVLLKTEVSRWQGEMEPRVEYQGRGCLRKTCAQPCPGAAGFSGGGDWGGS